MKFNNITVDERIQVYEEVFGELLGVKNMFLESYGTILCMTFKSEEFGELYVLEGKNEIYAVYTEEWLRKFPEDPMYYAKKTIDSIREEERQRKQKVLNSINN